MVGWLGGGGVERGEVWMVLRMVREGWWGVGGVWSQSWR